MKKQKELTTMGLIKMDAMEIELILEEIKRKSNTTTNGSNVNGQKPVLINQINEEDPDSIDAIRGNGYKGQNQNTIRGTKIDQ